MVEDKKVWPVALSIIACVLLLFFINIAILNGSIRDNSQANIDLSKVASKGDIDTLKTELTELKSDIAEIPVSTPTETLTNARLDEAVNEILSDIDEEKFVQVIADEYLNSKDFKKALAEFLNGISGNQSIESYKDISSVIVKDSDLDYSDSDNSAEVDYVLRVTFFNDGDDDLEDAVKAKIEVTLSIEDLKEKDNFDDAETTESGFVLIKVY